MTDKTIHVVFQVLNFLRSINSTEHAIIANDKLLLVFLAAHQGEYGIFPNQQTLANELHLTVRHIRDRLKYLASLGLISITRVKRKHHYTLNFLTQIEELQFPYSPQKQLQQRNPSSSSQRNPSSAHRGTPVPTNNNKNNQVNNSERAATKRAAPLTDDFLPTQATFDKAEELGLTEEEANQEVDKFMGHYLAKGIKNVDWDAALHKWFIQAGIYKRKNKYTATAPKQDEVGSTVPWFNGHDPLRAFEIAQKILPNGGSPNGLEGTTDGKTKSGMGSAH